jgi:hypothetical protein
VVYWRHTHVRTQTHTRSVQANLRDGVYLHGLVNMFQHRICVGKNIKWLPVLGSMRGCCWISRLVCLKEVMYREFISLKGNLLLMMKQSVLQPIIISRRVQLICGIMRKYLLLQYFI